MAAVSDAKPSCGLWLRMRCQGMPWLARPCAPQARRRSGEIMQAEGATDNGDLGVIHG